MNSMMRAAVVGVSLMMATTFAFATEQKAEQKPAAQSAAKDGQLDINTATEAELKAIPGLDENYAKKIIAGRPYTKKTQLKTKKIVPDDVYSKIKDNIVAKKAKK